MSEYYYIDIIIVNWNAGNSLKEAIESVIKIEEKKLKLNFIVVDNASTDKSIESIGHLNVKILHSAKNAGFGKACNLALPHCNGNYILLLNPDTQSSSSALLALVEILEKNEDIGVVGPQQVNETGKVARTCCRFPTLQTAIWDLTGLSKMMPKTFTPAPIMIDWPHDATRYVDHVMGSYMLIKRKAIDLAGFMDDRYFVYYEDVDLSKRIHEKGFKILYTADVQIFHEGGGASKTIKAKRLAYSLQAKINYWHIHFSRVSFLIATTLTLTVEPVARILAAISVFNFKQAGQTVQAFGSLYKKILSR